MAFKSSFDKKRAFKSSFDKGKGSGSFKKRKNAKSGFNTARGLMYSASKLLGDAQAVSSGKIIDRVERRITGKIAGSALGSGMLKFFQR
jgi:hypothetical protein